MIEDLLKFQLDLGKFKTQVQIDHANLCKRIAIRLHQSIVAGCPENSKGTPVDTGWARANWGVHIGRDGIPTKPQGTRPPDGSPPLPANAYFKNIKSIQIPRHPFIWVYNNVPYIETLENGHSGQAPTGMVANALNNVQTFIDNI